MTGRERFEFYLNQVQDLLNKAKVEENPGWWLFSNNLRTPVFMLEALSKLYGKLHDKSIFNKLQDRFKQLEDVLGDIDHYNAYESEYAEAAMVAAVNVTYLREQKEMHVQLLNELLSDEKWIDSETPRVDKIRKKLSEVNWLSEQEEMIAIKKFYLKAISSIQVFYGTTNGRFTDMEEEVHEIRRKLRWLSIYTQALRGSIQLSDKALPESYLEKYLVPDIVNSPFNKLPEPVGCRYVLLLEKNYFLALSWLIAELGKLKDAGLGIIVLEEASKHNRDDADSERLQSLSAAGKPSLQDYMTKASEITKAFFEEKNLEKLVGDVVDSRPKTMDNH